MSGTFKKIWLLCKKDWEHFINLKRVFTKGKCYEGTRLESDTWKVIDDRNKVLVLTYSEEIQTYFHHAFYENDFKNVCNLHPELIAPLPYEFDLIFKYYFDNNPDGIKHGEKTVDAIDVEEATEKVKNSWPNIHDIQVVGKI